MANQIRISTSCEIVQDNTVTVEGVVYTHKALDGNSDSRTWGGSYNISTAPVDDKICYWTNAVIDSASIDYLNDSDWTTSSAHTDGGIPSTVHVVAVECVNTIGSATHVDVTSKSEVWARLTKGESIVIPLHNGEGASTIGLTASHYSAGVDEVTVNVMIAGTAV